MTPQPQNKATARPWIYKHDDSGTRVSPAFGQFRLASLDSCGDAEREANAALIVEAVNNYDRLTAQNQALREIAQQIVLESENGNWPNGMEDILDQARAALAQT